MRGRLWQNDLLPKSWSGTSRCWPMFGLLFQIWPQIGKVRPTLANAGYMLAWAEPDQSSGPIGQSWTEFSPNSANVDKTLANVAEAYTLAKSGQHRQKFGQHPPAMATIGQNIVSRSNYSATLFGNCWTTAQPAKIAGRKFSGRMANKFSETCGNVHAVCRHRPLQEGRHHNVRRR